MYFDNFPTIPYDSELTGQFKDVKNLLTCWCKVKSKI